MANALKKTVLFLLILALLSSTLCFMSFAADPGAPVVQMSICARVIFVGHVWLYFRNITDHDIRVGVYTLSPGRGVSLGTMSASRVDGAGIYYNVEAYMTHRLGGFGSVGRTMTLNQSQLDVVNGRILERNTWTINDNCCDFATKVWNSVSPNHVDYHMLPVVVKGRIGSGGAPGMDDPSRNDVYRQHGSGAGASLSRVNDFSLIMYIG